jgi:hypothetical protein
MTIAVSMAKVVPGHERPVYNLLKSLEMTRKLYHIFGKHDFLLFLEAESIIKLTQLIDEIKEFAHINEVSTVLLSEMRIHEEARSMEAWA